MIKLQHKTSLEFVTLTPEEYLKLTDLKEYDPVDAEDVVTVYKSTQKGETADPVITDKENAEKMYAENPDLYILGHDWKFDDLFNDHQSRTLTDEERQKIDQRFNGIVDF